MVLPPATALDPATGETFEKMRLLALKDLSPSAGKDTGRIGTGVGCSRKLLQADALPECEGDEMYCWMRCMPPPEDGSASPEICAAQNLKYQCISQRDQLWRLEDAHGDYNPTCSNSTEFVTPPPEIPTPFAQLIGACNAGRKSV